MCLIRLIAHPGGAFLLGMAAVFGFVIITGAYDAAHPSRVIALWGIRESSPGVLEVPVPASQATLLSICADAHVSRLKSLSVLRQGSGSIFTYEAPGLCDSPVVRYRGGGSDPGSWVDWTDLNADGCFDERIDQEKAEWAIRAPDGWMPALMKEGKALAAQGEYEFCAEVGYWVPVGGQRGRGSGE